MIKISFILPAYKVEKYIEKSLNSILTQSDGDFEAIIVDDGSPDNSGKIADKFACADERIRVLHQHNSGTGCARNAGLEAARGEYIHFMDPDDYVEPDFVADNYKIAKLNDADIVCFGYFNEFPKGAAKDAISLKTSPMLNGKYTYEQFIAAYPAFFKDSHYLWNKLFKRSYLEENNCRFTSRSIGQDAVFNLTVYKYPFNTCLVTNEKCYYHYINRGDSSVNRFHADRVQDNFYITKATAELVEQWGKTKDEEYSAILRYSAVRDLHLGIKNVNMPSSPLSEKEKYEWLKNKMSDRELLRAVDKTPLSMFPRKAEKIKLIMLRCHLYRLVTRLNSRRNGRFADNSLKEEEL